MGVIGEATVVVVVRGGDSLVVTDSEGDAGESGRVEFDLFRVVFGVTVAVVVLVSTCNKDRHLGKATWQHVDSSPIKKKKKKEV